MAIIEVSGLSKGFRIPDVKRETLREHVLDRFRSRNWKTLRVLDSVSFEIQPGEVVGLMGRNGCGKSTLLKILSGIYQPDAGRVVARAPITPILELGVGWNPELDAVDNIYLLGTVMGLSLRELDKTLGDILAFAELEPFANLQLKHYSSGMSSRLAYAVAFNAVSEILILDEIFAVGDAGFQSKCIDRFQEFCAAGHTVILVSHDVTIIQRFCPRVILLEDGRVLADGPAGDVCDRYLHLLTDSSHHNA